MKVSRVSCNGIPKDAWKCPGQDRVFWGAYVNNSWELHTTDKVYDKDVHEGFQDTGLINLGDGEYGGICVTGDVVHGWNVVMSVGGFMHAMLYSGDCSDLLYYEGVGRGSYPRLFWNASVSLGVLLFIGAGKLFGRLTTDWLDYKAEIKASTFIINSLFGVGFIALWEGAETLTLLDWLGIYKELADQGLGGSNDYLEN